MKTADLLLQLPFNAAAANFLAQIIGESRANAPKRDALIQAAGFSGWGIKGDAPYFTGLTAGHPAPFFRPAKPYQNLPRDAWVIDGRRTEGAEWLKDFLALGDKSLSAVKAGLSPILVTTMPDVLASVISADSLWLHTPDGQIFVRVPQEAAISMLAHTPTHPGSLQSLLPNCYQWSAE